MSTVHVEGPLFDGRADAVMDECVVDVRHAVGDQGYSNVMGILESRIRNPTPYYQTQILVEDVADETVVHDRHIIYGPWLEGVGSRNSPKTRFPGYHAHKLAAQALNRGQAKAIAERVVAWHIPRMN